MAEFSKRSFIRGITTLFALSAGILTVADEPTLPPNGDIPGSPGQYTTITMTSTKAPVIVRPRVDPSQPQPNPQDFYSPELRREGLEGTAVVDVFVLADGTAGEMRIKQSSGAEGLDDAAKAVVQRMRFVAGTLNGAPSPMWARYAIGFKLEERVPATLSPPTPQSHEN